MVYRKKLAEGACDVYVPLRAVLATVSRDPQWDVCTVMIAARTLNA